MKLIYTLVLSFIVTAATQAQQLLSFKPNSLKKQITIELDDASYEEVLKVVVTNTSGRKLELRWDKEVKHQTLGWESQVCDKKASYPPNIRSNYDPIEGIRAPMQLNAGESFDLYLTILPYNKTGQCEIDIPFREISNQSKVIGTAVFQINIINNQEQEMMNAAGDKRIRIFPNPVHEHFFVANTPALGSLEIYNTLGRKIRTYDAPQAGDSFNAGDLPQGVYLVRLRDENGKVIRTLRLLRRDFRP